MTPNFQPLTLQQRIQPNNLINNIIHQITNPALDLLHRIQPRQDPCLQRRFPDITRSGR